ncbi:MAG: triose-phosphate isomerase [bacterium]
MAKSILIANWKNKPSSLREMSLLLAGLAKKSRLYKQIPTYIAPPHTYFESVSKRANGYSHLASQDISILPEGKHTGSVTVDILKSFGVRLAILGHSEVRTAGETDEQVSKKVRFALKAGITPLVCVGETQRDAEGEYLEFLRHQIKLSLEGLRRKDDVSKIVIAYEPIWAIGKRAQDAITPEDLSQIVLFIRRVLVDLFGRETAEKVKIIYGGSVEPKNAKVLFETGVRGFLIGHESLDAKGFAEIAEVLIKK